MKGLQVYALAAMAAAMMTQVQADCQAKGSSTRTLDFLPSGAVAVTAEGTRHPLTPSDQKCLEKNFDEPWKVHATICYRATHTVCKDVHINCPVGYVADTKHGCLQAQHTSRAACRAKADGSPPPRPKEFNVELVCGDEASRWLITDTANHRFGCETPKKVGPAVGAVVASPHCELLHTGQKQAVMKMEFSTFISAILIEGTYTSEANVVPRIQVIASNSTSKKVTYTNARRLPHMPPIVGQNRKAHFVLHVPLKSPGTVLSVRAVSDGREDFTITKIIVYPTFEGHAKEIKKAVSPKSDLWISQKYTVKKIGKNKGLSVSGLSARAEGAQACTLSSYTRGVGTVPTTCPAGTYNGGGFCYDNCKDGYYDASFVCWQRCGTDYTDTGCCCTRWADSYGNGCHGGCTSPYVNTGCTCFRPASTYAKDSYIPGNEGLPGCGDGNEKDAGLCYPNCKAGYSGVGPVCWGSCPGEFPYNCGGVTCTKDGDTCTELITRCVTFGPETILTIASCIGIVLAPSAGTVLACAIETFGNVMAIKDIVEMFDPVWMCDTVGA